MPARWARVEGNDLRSALCRDVAVVQLSHPWLAGGRVIRKVDKPAFDIKITGPDGVFALLCGQLKIISWDKQMYFLHPAIHVLTGIAPQVHISTEL